MSQQCHTVKKTNIILGYINRSLVCKTHEVILPLYSVFPGPQQKYCIQFGTVLQESGEGPKESNKNNQKSRKDNPGKD